MTEEYADDLFEGGERLAEEAKDQERVTELMALIRKHRDLYYNGTPEISDSEFDAYVDELRDLDPTNDVLFEVGAPVDKDSPFEKGTHNIPMASLDKVNTEEELQAWMKNRYSRWYTIEEKLDGFSLSFDYVDGVLKRVLTRGHGKEGEDITRNAIKMRGVKQRLPTKFTGPLRGEAMFMLPEFKAYNERAAKTKGWEPYKNMRNGAAGLARRRNGEGVEFLRVLFYAIEGGLEFKSQFERMSFIRNRLGLWTPWYARVDYEGAVKIYRDYSDRKRARLPYEIDGLVVKVDGTQDAQEIEDALQKGNRLVANPKSQVAWKFESEKRVTTVTAVAADFGLGGRITPVAEVKPVKIGGVTVTRASLHYWKDVARLGLKVGSKVLIERANDVIPQVMQVLDDKGTPVETPTVCPKCGEKLTLRGVALLCENKMCPGLRSGKIRKWVQKLEIDYVGMSVIQPLVDQGKLLSVTDLYYIRESEIAEACGKGVAKRAMENIQAKKVVPIDVFFGALSIPSFGTTLARLLVKAGFDTVDKMMEAKIPDFAAVEGFGTERATLVWNGLRDNEAMIHNLNRVLVIQSPQAKGGVLKGKSFCITGSLSAPKKVFQQMIEDAGGEYTSSLKKGVDYLIAEDPSGSSNKLQNARKWGTVVLDEDGFKKLVAG